MCAVPPRHRMFIRCARRRAPYGPTGSTLWAFTIMPTKSAWFSLPRHASMREKLCSSLRTEQSKKRRWRASSISASIKRTGRGCAGTHSHYRRWAGGAGSGLADGAARPALRAARNAAGPADAGAPNGPVGRVGVQQFAQSEQESTAPWLLKEELRRLGSLLIAAAPKREYPAAMRSPWTATFSRPKSPAPSPRIRASRSGARRSPPSPRTDHHHCHRPADQRRVRPGNRTADRLRPAVLLRQHQPDRGGGFGRQGIAFRASRYGKSLDGTADYLNCPFDRPQYEASSTPCCKRKPSPPTSRKTARRISKLACPSRNWPAAAATRCASAP